MEDTESDAFEKEIKYLNEMKTVKKIALEQKPSSIKKDDSLDVIIFHKYMGGPKTLEAYGNGFIPGGPSI